MSVTTKGICCVLLAVALCSCGHQKEYPKPSLGENIGSIDPDMTKLVEANASFVKYRYNNVTDGFPTTEFLTCTPNGQIVSIWSTDN